MKLEEAAVLEEAPCVNPLRVSSWSCRLWPALADVEVASKPVDFDLSNGPQTVPYLHLQTKVRCSVKAPLWVRYERYQISHDRMRAGAGGPLQW